MAKPYSADLRRRVVGTIEGGTTIPEAAEQCGVSISSVVRWVKLRNTQHEQMSSALAPRTDIGLARPQNVAQIECYGTSLQCLLLPDFSDVLRLRLNVG